MCRFAVLQVRCYCENAFGLTLDEFYNEFALWFDQTPKSEKLKIIDVISKY